MKLHGVSDIHRWLIYLAAVVMICLTGQSIRLGHDVDLSLNDLATAETDNLQWTLSQLEVDHLKYLVQAKNDLEAGNLRALRRSFDIYYSRIVTVWESHLYAAIRTGDTKNRLERLYNGLQRHVSLIDGSDQVLIAAQKDLIELILADSRDVRELALSGVILQTELAGDKRRHLHNLFADLAMVLIALVCALFAATIVLLRLYRRGIAQAERIAQDAARMETMVSASLDAVVMADRDGRVIAMSASGEAVFGLDRAAALGRPMAHLVPDLAFVNETWGSTWLADLDLDGEQEGRLLLTGRRGDGSEFPAELSVSISGSGPNPVLVSYVRDISNRLRAEQDLKQARDDALAGEQAKARLLTVMSHEMRTPLNGILGSLDLLEQTKVAPQQMRYLEAMRVSGELLLHHVNDVLELSRLEAGATAETPQVFDLDDLVQSLIGSQKANAARNTNELSAFCSLGPITGVHGARRSLQQVLLNLIGNALKFTQNGAVSVDAVRQAGDLVEFSIADTGKGIAEADLERIFDEFTMLDPSYARGAEGTGLGLAISRRLVAAMGGQIQCESTPGEGSIFSFSIPLPACDLPETRLPHQELRCEMGKEILVIEDNQINRMLMEDMLQKQGHRVTSAEGGLEGLKKIQEGLFDLILSDISMPDIDGLEVIRRVQQQGLAEDTEIVAITAHAAAEDHARIREAGFAEVLTKPVTQGDLADLIRRLCGDAEEGAFVDIQDETSAQSNILEFANAVGPSKARGFLEEFQREVKLLAGDLGKAATLSEHLQQEAHRLAGSAAVLGFSGLRQSLLEIELADAGTPPEIAHLTSAWMEAESLIAEYLAA